MQRIILLTVLIMVFTVSPVMAENSFSMDGQIDSQDSTEVMPVDENHILLKIANSGTITLDDVNNPLHGAEGSCSGTVLIVTGKPTGSGFCLYKDADDDMAIISWSVNSLNDKGGNNGKWEFAGGTGKYISAIASGQYSSVPNADRTESVNTVTGEIKFK